MSNGKRRANWETVLEARMNVAQMLISNLNTDILNQITDLQNQVDAMNQKLSLHRYILIGLGFLTGFAAIVAVLK